MLLCTLLTFALCADPATPAAIAFGDVTAPIVWSRAQLPGCMDLGRTSTPADAQLETALSIQNGSSAGAAVSGRLVLRLLSAKIQMTAFAWPKMTPAERQQMRAVYRATLWHELGHLVTARASIAAENARPENELAADSQAAFLMQLQARSDAAFARFNADQNGYDAVTEHGIRQADAPLPLTGADTIAHCG